MSFARFMGLPSEFYQVREGRTLAMELTLHKERSEDIAKKARDSEDGGGINGFVVLGKVKGVI